MILTPVDGVEIDNKNIISTYFDVAHTMLLVVLFSCIEIIFSYLYKIALQRYVAANCSSSSGLIAHEI